MMIAQIAPPIESVPPKKYGGTERVVSELTEELVRRGHSVTLFASGDSQTSGRLIPTLPKSIREMYPTKSEEWVHLSHLHLGTAYSLQDQFDIIHDHTGLFGAPFAHNSRTPVVLTLHGPIDERTETMFTQFQNPYTVTISLQQASKADNFNHVGTVYNGLKFDHYPASSIDGSYLLYVGRICPQKGLHHAITVSEKTGLRLVIAAKYEPYQNRDYFDTAIKPKLSRRIKWLGEVNEETRNQLYAHAKAFLHPATWAEPFGLTLIEAMACGCPIIAFDRGSIPEIVWNKKTGYVVTNVQEMIAAVKKIREIDRKRCVEYARTTFNARKMAVGYERIYRKILDKHIHKEENLIRFMHSTLMRSANSGIYARLN